MVAAGRPTATVHRRAAAAVAFAVAAVVAVPAQARDMTGKAGVGVLVGQPELPLVVVRYWRTHFAIEVLAGWSAHEVQHATVVVRDGVPDPSPPFGPQPSPIELAACMEVAAEARADAICTARTGISHTRVAIGLLWKFGDAARATLAFGLRPWLHLAAQSTVVAHSTARKDTWEALPNLASAPALPTRWGVDLPVATELFLNDHVSLVGQVALRFGSGEIPHHPTTAVERRTSDGSTWLTITGAWSGGAGVTYYF